MAITKKMFLAFVLTIVFVISSIHCFDDTQGFEIKQEYKQCYTPDPCHRGGNDECDKFCVAKSGLLYGKCIYDGSKDVCCCMTK